MTKALKAFFKNLLFITGMLALVCVVAGTIVVIAATVEYHFGTVWSFVSMGTLLILLVTVMKTLDDIWG